MCKKIRFVSNNWSINNRKRSSCMWEGNNCVVRVKVIKVFGWTWCFLGVFFSFFKWWRAWAAPCKRSGCSSLGQLINNSCIAAGLQFEVSCPQFMASFITAVCGENVVFFGVLGSEYLSSEGVRASLLPLSCRTSQTTTNYFSFLPQTSSDVTGAGFLSWNLGHLVPTTPPWKRG